LAQFPFQQLNQMPSVTGTEVGGPVATEHSVNTATIKSKTIRLRQ
jgi:hypothetical protein